MFTSGSSEGTEQEIESGWFSTGMTMRSLASRSSTVTIAHSRSVMTNRQVRSKSRLTSCPGVVGEHVEGAAVAGERDRVVAGGEREEDRVGDVQAGLEVRPVAVQVDRAAQGDDLGVVAAADRGSARLACVISDLEAARLIDDRERGDGP